jgi:hypothetical protein
VVQHRISNPTADLMVYDSYGQLVALVVTTTQEETTVRWAIRERARALAWRPHPTTRFYLIVAPERVYVWKDVPVTAKRANPTLVGDIPRRLLRGWDVAGTYPLYRDSCIVSVRQWLTDLQEQRPYMPEELIPEWVREVGLIDAILDGDVIESAYARAETNDVV